MKDKLNRAKETFQKHRAKIAFGSGVLVGATGIIVLVATRPPFEIFLPASQEALQKLIDNPNGAIQWTHTSGAVVNVVNEAHSQLQ